MAKSEIRNAGIRAFNAEVRQIMDDHGVDRWEAMRIRRNHLNGAPKKGKIPRKELALEDVADKSDGVTIDSLEGIVKSRLDTLEAKIETLQSDLDDAKTEIAKWQRVAVAIARHSEQHREGV